MLSEFGKTRIFQFFSGQAANIANAISVGVDNTSSLSVVGFEVARYPISFIGVQGNSLVFKARAPEFSSYEVREIALVSDTTLTTDLARFGLGAADTVWSSGTLSPVGKIGTQSLALTASTFAASFAYDLSNYSDLSKLKVAFNSLTATNVVVRLGTDDANYYQFTFPSSGSGYQTKQLNRSTAVVVGTPNWATINYIYFSGGTLSVDGLRMEEESPVVARVAVTPFRKIAGIPLELEYPLLLSVA